MGVKNLSRPKKNSRVKRVARNKLAVDDSADMCVVESHVSLK